MHQITRWRTIPSHPIPVSSTQAEKKQVCVFLLKDTQSVTTVIWIPPPWWKPAELESGALSWRTISSRPPWIPPSLVWTEQYSNYTQNKSTERGNKPRLKVVFITNLLYSFEGIVHQAWSRGQLSLQTQWSSTSPRSKISWGDCFFFWHAGATISNCLPLTNKHTLKLQDWIKKLTRFRSGLSKPAFFLLLDQLVLIVFNRQTNTLSSFKTITQRLTCFRSGLRNYKFCFWGCFLDRHCAPRYCQVVL